MSRRVRTHAVLLKTLAHCSAKQRRLLLQSADRGLIDAICECVVNVLRGNVHLSPVHKRSLAKHRHKLRKLGDRKTPLKERKRIITQQGGFFLPLLSRLISPVLGILSNLVTGGK